MRAHRRTRQLRHPSTGSGATVPINQSSAYALKVRIASAYYSATPYVGGQYVYVYLNNDAGTSVNYYFHIAVFC